MKNPACRSCCDQNLSIAKAVLVILLMTTLTLGCNRTNAPPDSGQPAPGSGQQAKTPTRTSTPAARPNNPTATPTRAGATLTRTPTKTRVNVTSYQNAYIKRIDELRLKYQQLNCSPTPGYSGCWEDIFGMPTALRNYLYGDYWANVHSSYLTFARSLEEQMLPELEKCFAQFIENRTKIPNLDVRKGEQGACISKMADQANKDLERIRGTSCRAACGEVNKIGVVEGMPLECACK